MRDAWITAPAIGPWRRAFSGGCRLAAARYESTPAKVRRHVLRMLLERGIGPRIALRSGLADPRVPARVLDGAISKRALVALQRRVNPDALFYLTGDKAIFDALCRAWAIPVPPILAALDGATGHTGDGTALTTGHEWERFLLDRTPSTFIVKPARSGFGEGVMLLARDGDEFLTGASTRHSARSLFDMLAAASRPWVIQERLASHPDIVRLSGSPLLQTVRMTTFVDAQGRARMPYANFKLTAGGNVADNFDNGRTGNLIANVGPDGRLGQAMTVARDGVGVLAVPAHPATGAAFDGFQLPDWEAAVALVCRAARRFLPVRTLGWDVALTPHGPVVVEANHFWDPVPILLAGPQPPGVTRHGMVTMLELLRDGKG